MDNKYTPVWTKDSEPPSKSCLWFKNDTFYMWVDGAGWIVKNKIDIFDWGVRFLSYEYHSGSEYHSGEETHNGHEYHRGGEEHEGYETHSGSEYHSGSEAHYGEEYHYKYEYHAGEERHRGTINFDGVKPFYYKSDHPYHDTAGDKRIRVSGNLTYFEICTVGSSGKGYGTWITDTNINI